MWMCLSSLLWLVVDKEDRNELIINYLALVVLPLHTQLPGRQ